MKYIKTFEKFFKRWFKKPDLSKSTADFNDIEKKKLKELNFDNISKNNNHSYIYKSESSNLIIKIYKYFEFDFVFSSYFEVDIYKDDEEKTNLSERSKKTNKSLVWWMNLTF